jgi:hypothetical protein
MGIGLTCAFIGRDLSKEVFRQPCQMNSFERNISRPLAAAPRCGPSLRPAGALPAECVFYTFPITEFARLGAPEDGAGAPALDQAGDSPRQSQRPGNLKIYLDTAQQGDIS